MNEQRKHSKYSASGAERWIHCPGSVSLSEGVPDKDSPWSLEGTKAHEVLETILNRKLIGAPKAAVHQETPEMVGHGKDAANFILGIHRKHLYSEILVETRIQLGFIHPEMFGTFDGAVIDHFGTLHVFDYKYGKGHAVSPVDNLQMLFYGLGLAHFHHWNFNQVRLWIIQPRIRGYDGPTFWELPILKLRSYEKVFKKGVERVEKNPSLYAEGQWCHWCKAKNKCPLKQEVRREKAISVFKASPLTEGK